MSEARPSPRGRGVRSFASPFGKEVRSVASPFGIGVHSVASPFGRGRRATARRMRERAKEISLMADRIRGVWCATLTPLDSAGAPDARMLSAHIERLFAAGVDGIALFGTTGEGQSFSVAQRRGALDALLAAGIPAGRIVAGTGCAALADTIELTLHAVSAGCAGALVLPPFFFKGPSEEGVYASYARLIDGVADARFRLYLS